MKVSFSTKLGAGLLSTFGAARTLQPLGFLEEIGVEVIRGWVFHPRDAGIVLRLKLGDETVDLQPQWIDRLDVAANHGVKAIRSGFFCVPDSMLCDKLETAFAAGIPVAVTANDVALPAPKDVVKKARRDTPWENLPHAREYDKHASAEMGNAEMAVIPREAPKPALSPLHWAALDIGIHKNMLTARLESWAAFSVRGWAVIDQSAPRSISVIVGGAEYPLSAIWSPRPEAASRHGASSDRIGFEIGLPGYLWDAIALDADLEVGVLADGELLNPRPLLLTRKQALRWIEDLVDMPDSDEQQFRSLLALEHVRFGRFAAQLSESARCALAEFCERMHLADYLPELQPAGAAAARAGEDVDSLLLWAVMRELNASLLSARASHFTLIRDNPSWRNLPEQAREWYLSLAVQLTCESGEFPRLRELADLSMFQKHEWSDDAGQLTLALPALVAEQQVSRATDLLLRLAKKAGSGRIDTENLRFSVSQVQELERRGELDFTLAEKFRYAYIWLLDCFKGEWFSRLHDLKLIEALVCLLGDLERYTDHHKRDLVAAAIRHYGLCPTFWDLMDRQPAAVGDEELAAARRAWRRLQQALTQLDADPGAGLHLVSESLEFFRHKSNPETVIFLREVVANHLAFINREMHPAGLALIKTLTQLDATEALRVAAFPLPDESRIAHRFPETSTQLPRIARQLIDGPKSAVYELQLAASVALRRAQEKAAAGSPAEVADALDALESMAVALANWQGGFLGADLLASCYLLARQAGVDEKRFLMRLSQLTRRVTQETNADYYIPAPLYAALARLGAMPGDAILQSFLAEAQQVIEGKFGARHGSLFAAPAPGGPAASAWPADTLVLIDSCQERLPSFVAAIRETWMRDLQARGIPCLVVVEGEKEGLRGDILTLALAEIDQHGPRKTLRLLEWVHAHTDAQFVLKIEDDCYLNVDRVFDTLTYRKHLYSGRVIRRAAGEFERSAHQARAKNAHARYSLDKSREASFYADGAGAVCFSRLAIHKLLEAQRSEAGSRLIADSFQQDKMVGDLLALNNIYPSNEDCEHVHRQRTFESAVPVAFQENAFLPSLHAPAKVVHLDRAEDFATTRERAGKAELWPKKIWASSMAPSIKPNSNQLELLGSLQAANRLLGARLVVVAVVRNEMIMLPHFLDHYRRLGVKCFIFVDNCSDDGSREYLLEQADTIVYSAETAYRHSHYGVTWQQAVMANHCLGKWVLLADADEFLVYPGCEEKSMELLVGQIEAEGADSAFIHMIDMYPFADLSDACFETGRPFDVAPFFDRQAQYELRFGGGHFSNSKNFVNGLRHRLAPSRINSYVSQKYALFRYYPWIRVTEGVHYAANMKLASKPVYFAHFKYHAGFKDKVLTEIKRKQHFNGAEEYRRYAGMLAEGGGGFGNPRYTVQYNSSESFVELFK